MKQGMHTISVVIPTHNRCNLLRRTLDAVSKQDFSMKRIEVVVVMDGCTDKTNSMLQTYSAPFRLTRIEQKKTGPGAARNNGAAKATGWLLIFLDDDVVPEPRWIAAHVRVHNKHKNQVVIGYYPPATHPKPGYVGMAFREWWHDKFHAMQHPAHRFSYQDLLSGNCSIQRDLFDRMGGFNVTFPCAHEDYEFGVRLLKSGVTFIFSAEAVASHVKIEKLKLADMFRRARREGTADFLIGSLHPELISTLPFFAFVNPKKRIRRIMNFLAFFGPNIGDILAGLLQMTLQVIEGIQARSRWQYIYKGLYNYWYLRGLVDAVGTRDALVTFVQDGAFPPASEEKQCEMTIDLDRGISDAIQSVDQTRPLGLRVMFDSQLVGQVTPKPGHEPLRGVHLQSALATDLIWPLFMIIMQQTALDPKAFPMVAKHKR